MDINKLEILLTTVDCGSMKKAAEELNYTQSGLIYMINSVENEMGIHLLTRTHKGVALTKEGEMLLPYIRKIVEASNSMQEEINGLTNKKHERLYIGGSPAIVRNIFTDLVSKMMEKYPDLDIQIFEGMTVIADMLENDKIDLSVIEKRTAGDNNKWIPLMNIIVYAALPASFPVKENGLVTFDELRDYPIIVPEYANSSFGSETLLELAKQHGCTKSISVMSSSGTSLLHMVGDGLGTTFLSGLYRAECPENVRMYPTDPPIIREVGIATKKTRNDITGPMRDFITLIKAYVKKSPWVDGVL